MPPDVRVVQRNMFWKQSSTIRGEADANYHEVSVKAFTEQCRIQEYIFAPSAKGYSWFTCQVNWTRHTYELKRSDGGPKVRDMTMSHEILYWVTFEITWILSSKEVTWYSQ